ncbi:MAG: flagellin [Desulfovibrio sp.]|nr:flagellin [Desulfovibrio sp.]
MSLVVNNNLMASSVANTLNGHYGRLSTSIQRLSSGMRINSAADDAAGLAIRELQRADIAALQQGARNANDAISLIQTADGALGVIDEKLIRMKELAEQAATGTYDSTQRLMIESEYQAMASEITRIANATDFNNIKLLNGSLSGAHDGSGLTSTGSLKIHFGSGNDSAEDYYYIQIGDCTAAALGVGNKAASKNPVTFAATLSPNGDEVREVSGFITLDGKPYTPIRLDEDMRPVLTDNTVKPDGEPNLFYYRPDANVYTDVVEGNNVTPRGQTYGWITSAGGGRSQLYVDSLGHFPLEFYIEGTYYEDANGNKFSADELITGEIPTGEFETVYSDAYTVSTQEAAQRALVGINNAIVSKDKIRAHLGAIQNRLENTITNLSVQSENLLAAESRISDVDVATEMTEFVRNQILTQSAVAMLSQANSLPQMAMQLIGG